MATSSRRSSGAVLPMASAFQRSVSPGGRFHGSMAPDASSFSSNSSFASSMSSSFYSSPSADFFHRPNSPTRVRFHGLAPLSPTPSVRFSIDRSTSPRRAVAVSSRDQVVRNQQHHHHHHHHHHHQHPHMPKKTCLCSPTTHPGSFRCSLHKNFNSSSSHSHSISYSPSRLTVRRSAMTNSLVRIGTVEGDLMKRALAALIRPSSHQIRRRTDFQPRPSRLSVMSKAEDLSNAFIH